MPRTPTWQAGHAHPHTTRFVEHEHGDLATQEAIDLEHVAFGITEDTFEQGPEANRTMDDGPATGREADEFAVCPVDHGRGFRCEHSEGIGHQGNHFMEADEVMGTDRLEWDGPDENDNLTATSKSSNGPTAQTGFGDHVVNTEEDEGIKFLALLDERKEIQALASRFTKINFDIKKQLITRSLITGGALRIRVAAHILNLSDKSEDKEQDAKTRAGTQHLSVVHPE